MKPETTEDILELLQGHVAAAAVGAAMELGLFWLLADQPLPASDVADALDIPFNRCHHWLRLLCHLGLLEAGADGYSPSVVARKTILDAQSQHFWAFHAREDRATPMGVRDLAVNIRRPVPAWETPSLARPDYYQQILDNPGYAAAFTRMLYEIHLPLAAQLADLIDLRGVTRLLDLGGGSGVVSFALLRKWPALTAVVVDVEPVCRVGRDLAAEGGLEQRIEYLAADLLRDDLPTGLDVVLVCDVGLFDPALLARIYGALNSQGRLVIVDKFAPSETDAPPSRLSGAFLTSLQHPAPAIHFTTVDEVHSRLRAIGFRDLSITAVPPRDNLPWNVDWTMLQARK